MFCLLRNECSVFYLRTNHKHLKSSYLGFSLFLSRLCADKLNRSHLHIEIRHVKPSQETKRFHNQRFWCCRDKWSDQICKCLQKDGKSIRQTQTTAFAIAFIFVDCFKLKHEYSQDIKINIIFLLMLSIFASHVLIRENRDLEIKFVG